MWQKIYIAFIHNNDINLRICEIGTKSIQTFIFIFYYN